MGEFIYGLLANAVLPHKLRQTQVNEFANVSRITILLYDILINLEREKRLVWDAKFRASSVLYYVLRYPVIAFQVFTIFESHITSQLRFALQIHFHAIYHLHEDRFMCLVYTACLCIAPQRNTLLLSSSIPDSYRSIECRS
ncbi:hypothetical protein BDW22DRAFT_131793 [Trametopsis cervina]|nr:hypothetical protein BDW22DRAFT_131793 [Trametopsis cervina]